MRTEKTDDMKYYLKEKKMSLKAKGLLSLMLSLPTDWNYTIPGLISMCNENTAAIRTALDELKRFGYLTVIKQLPNETKSGRLEYKYIVSETPNKLTEGDK